MATKIFRQFYYRLVRVFLYEHIQQQDLKAGTGSNEHKITLWVSVTTEDDMKVSDCSCRPTGTDNMTWFISDIYKRKCETSI